MAKTKTITLYEFDELSDQAKEKARDWYRSCRDASDFDFTKEDVEKILGILGVSLKYHQVPLHGGGTRNEPNIWWSLGYSQSDGACFEGTYTYAKQAHRHIRRHAPKDEELHRIADTLLEIQKRHRYKLYATVRNTQGFWPEVEVDTDDAVILQANAYEEVRELIRDLCRWIYQQFRQEDEYQSADEQVDDNIRGNEYTFTEAGDRED